MARVIQQNRTILIGAKKLNNQLGKKAFVFQNFGQTEQNYVWQNGGAEAYYNALSTAGLTPGKIGSLYNCTVNFFKATIDQFWTDCINLNSTIPNRFWLFLGDDANMQSIEGNTATSIGTSVGSPSYTFEGIVLNGTSQYYDSGVTPGDASQTSTVCMNGAAFGGFTNTASRAVMGCSNSSTQASLIRHSAIPLWEARCYTTTGAPSAARGVKSRVSFGQDGTNAYMVLDGVQSTGSRGASVPTINYYFGALNSSGSAINYAPITFGFAFIDNTTFLQSKADNYFTAYDNLKNALGRTY